MDVPCPWKGQYCLFQDSVFKRVVFPGNIANLEVESRAPLVARMAVSLPCVSSKESPVWCFPARIPDMVLPGVAGHAVLIWGGQLSRNLRTFKIVLSCSWCSFESLSCCIYFSACILSSCLSVFVCCWNVTLSVWRFWHIRAFAWDPVGEGSLGEEGTRGERRESSLRDGGQKVLAPHPEGAGGNWAGQQTWGASCPAAASFSPLSRKTLCVHGLFFLMWTI